MQVELRNCDLEINHIGTPEVIALEMLYRGFNAACQEMAAFFDAYSKAIDETMMQMVVFGSSIMKVQKTSSGTVRWNLDNDTMNWTDTIPKDKTPTLSDRKIWKMTQMRNPKGLR